MLRRQHIVAKVFRGITWHFVGKDKELFLSFDDGPNPDITPWVLSVLKEFNAKATFFCVGNKVEKYPDIYKQILIDGHCVGNHTYSHLKGWSVANNNYLTDVSKAEKFIKTNLFRPPYGKIRPYQLKKIKENYRIIMWDVLSRDYDKKISNKKCLERVTDYAESGSIIVFHDTPKAENNLKYVLPKVLKYYTDKGFVFNAISCVLYDKNTT